MGRGVGYLLKVGWSMSRTSSPRSAVWTAPLSSRPPGRAGERAEAQGVADMTMGIAGGAGGTVSGIVVGTVGYPSASSACSSPPSCSFCSSCERRPCAGVRRRRPAARLVCTVASIRLGANKHSAGKRGDESGGQATHIGSPDARRCRGAHAVADGARTPDGVAGYAFFGLRSAPSTPPPPTVTTECSTATAGVAGCSCRRCPSGSGATSATTAPTTVAARSFDAHSTSESSTTTSRTSTGRRMAPPRKTTAGSSATICDRTATSS